MSTDLHAQLLAAVEARRQLALAATPGPWVAKLDYPQGVMSPAFAAKGSATADVDVWLISTTLSHNPDAAAAFIAANDPATVIRHCERDLKVLQRHGPRKSRWHLVSGQEYEVCCRTCAEVDHDVPAPWPCDEIRDLADAYAVPTSSKGEAMATPDEVYELAAKAWRHMPAHTGGGPPRELLDLVDAAFAAGRRAAAEAIRTEERRLHAIDGVLIDPPFLDGMENAARLAEGSPS